MSKNSLKGASIESVIKAVKKALLESESKPVAGFPPMSSITVNLQSKVVQTQGRKFKFLIFSFGKEKKFEKTHSLKFVLKPPEAEIQLKAIETPDLQSVLANAIIMAKEGYNKTKDDEPKTNLDSVTIVIQFVVFVDKNGGIDTADLLPIGLSGTRKATVNQVHSIEIKFAVKK